MLKELFLRWQMIPGGPSVSTDFILSHLKFKSPNQHCQRKS